MFMCRNFNISLNYRLLEFQDLVLSNNEDIQVMFQNNHFPENIKIYVTHLTQYMCSITQLCPTLYDSMDSSPL